MKDPRLARMLAELPVPPSDRACAETATTARGHVGRTPMPTRRRVNFRNARIAIPICLLAGALISPPGRAAVERAGELVGIGEVGGKATLEPHVGGGSEPTVVHAGGELTGEPYEWVAYRAKGMFCIGLDWTERKFVENVDERMGTACEGRRSAAELRGPSPGFSGYGYEIARTGGPSEDRDVIMHGVMREDVVGLEMAFTDAGGQVHQVPVDFKRIDGALLEQVGGHLPFGVFVAAIDGEVAPPVDKLDDLQPQLNYLPYGSPWPEGTPERCKRRVHVGPIDFMLLRDDGERETIHTAGGRWRIPGC